VPIRKSVSLIEMFNVNHIAKLARLGLNEDEKAKFAKELAAILAFVAKLKEVDTQGVQPTAQVAGLQNVSRADESKKGEGKCRQHILANAPETKDDFIKVKAVFD